MAESSPTPNPDYERRYNIGGVEIRVTRKQDQFLAATLSINDHANNKHAATFITNLIVDELYPHSRNDTDYLFRCHNLSDGGVHIETETVSEHDGIPRLTWDKLQEACQTVQKEIPNPDTLTRKMTEAAQAFAAEQARNIAVEKTRRADIQKQKEWKASNKITPIVNDALSKLEALGHTIPEEHKRAVLAHGVEAFIARSSRGGGRTF